MSYDINQSFINGTNGTTYTNNGWNYHMGFEFIPQKDGTITRLGGYFNGTKTVTIYDTSYNKLAEAVVTSSNNWAYADINSPLKVTAGVTYYCIVNVAGSGGSYDNACYPNGQVYHDVKIVRCVYTDDATFRAEYLNTTHMYGMSDFTINYNTPPTDPVITSPTSNDVIHLDHTVTWDASIDADGNPLTYEVELFTDSVGDWKTLSSIVSGTSYVYNFMDEPETLEAQIRVRAFDGYSYSNWSYSPLFEINHRVKIGIVKIQLTTSIIEIPVYDTQYVDGCLRFMTDLGIGFLHLVPVTDVKASPMRVMTKDGIKAIERL